MYKQNTYRKSGFNVNTATQGEHLETKIERMISNKEKMKDGAPLLYTERSKGVIASTNIRTDRFEVAIDASEKIAKSYKARREEKAKMPKKDSETEPTQGKSPEGDTAITK